MHILAIRVDLPLSRSTWACELKYLWQKETLWQRCHAPRERVSWNLMFSSKQHVIPVTLHVSVWVEICDTSLTPSCWKSRSTWACELKWWFKEEAYGWECHAPRERVSWNTEEQLETYGGKCHAPRERVSWNMIWQSAIPFIKCHAPRERVSWNSHIKTR